ncbi:MAG: DNA topoisomerase VI subunit B [Planctomycetota bacterium]|nr:DNA topoisomerase VI subunit B [Planctomycetota bacterium]
MARKKARYSTAKEMAAAQREISVAEFFAKNRHLLGFDNANKALLTTVREAVDNALDACEEAGILPELTITIDPVRTKKKDGKQLLLKGANGKARKGFGGASRLTVSVQDNGPGILREQIPKIFGKLLYGSKFHRLRMSRGQQGIGISAAALYAQMTTGQPVLITSRTSARAKPHRYRIGINLAKNAPEDKEVDVPASEQVPQGTRVELEIEGRYQRHGKSVDQYLKQTAVANPHARITFRDPEGEQVVHERVSKALPEPTREIKPHPYGVELGVLIKMMRDSSSRTVKGFLQTDFSRVSARIAKQILKEAGISEGYHPKTIARDQADNLYEAIQETKIMAPPTDCLSPIGEKQLEKGLEKEFDLEFVTSATRPPTVYRGNPFQIEAAVGYGGELPADEPAQVLRFANRVPLLYQGGACAITKAVAATAWRNYKLSQPRGSLPVGPLVIVVHMASVWVPFTSEAKEAVANYDVILQEVRRALQECGRRIGVFINKRKRIADEARKLSFITLYLPHIGIALQEILKLTDKERDQTCRKLERILERTRKSS